MLNSKEKEAKRFEQFLLDEDNIKLLSAFMADLLSVFSRYQKNSQSDSTTVLDMTKANNLVIERIKT
jgi:N-acetylneuraminic acid mutarotase